MTKGPTMHPNASACSCETFVLPGGYGQTRGKTGISLRWIQESLLRLSRTQYGCLFWAGHQKSYKFDTINHPVGGSSTLEFTEYLLSHVSSISLYMPISTHYCVVSISPFAHKRRHNAKSSYASRRSSTLLISPSIRGMYQCTGNL